ncbi:MAG: 50S ribosomal protein L25 [Candidatus Izemoplasmatales bacterium]|jgi:large subunit ribosomal protein L25|nr:50S ribosomal protein L25 [Candidatus Izemoplasmatales bacterium]
MKLEKRTETLKSVRESNKIPGVLFGKTIEPEAIQIDEKDFKEAFKNFGLTQTFEVKLGRKKHNVYIKDIQRHHINHNLFLNVKLLKVVEGDLIHSHLPIHLLGKEKIEKPGIIVQLLSDSIEVEYGIGSSINHIDLDVSNLKVGDSVTVGDLSIPEGINVLDDHDKAVLNVSETKYVEEEQEPEEEVDAMDVEVITEKDKTKDKDKE